MGICSGWWSRACNYLFLRDEAVNRVKTSDEEFLKEAYQELIEAQNLFARVDDPDMIDYAIYTLKAAEKRYDFLLKRIKNKRKR